MPQFTVQFYSLIHYLPLSVCIAARAVCIIYQAKYTAAASAGKKKKKKEEDKRTGTGLKYKKMAQTRLAGKWFRCYIKLSEALPDCVEM